MPDLAISQIPANLKTPFDFFEVNANKAGAALFPQRTLITGRQNTDATAATDTPHLIISKSNAVEQFGEGSPLALMADAFFLNNPAGELWGMPVQFSGTTRVDDFDFTGTITAATLTLNGVKHDLASTTPAAIVAEINLLADLPFIATVSASTTVRLTSKANGADEYYRVRMGKNTANVAPAKAAGTGAPAPNFAGLGDMAIDFYIAEQSNSAYLNALATFIDGRWEALSGLYGYAFAAIGNRDAANLTPTNALAAANGRNNAHESIIGINSPTPDCIIAAAAGGAAVRELIADPARPMQTVAVRGITPPTQGDIWALTERNTLLNGGVATLTVSPTGDIAIERFVSTYQTDSNGNTDTAWLDCQTSATLARVIREQSLMLRQLFNRAKLADDGTQIPPNSVTTTPALIKAAIVSKYKQQEAAGLVEGVKAFAANAIVQRHSQDRNRVDADLPINLQNQLRVIAIRVSFIV